MTGKTIREILITVLLVLFVFCIVAVRKADHAAAGPTPLVAGAQNAWTALRSDIALNRGLPAMIDSQTMMTRAEAGATVETYYITTVNHPARRLGREFFARAQEIVSRRNCDDHEIRMAYDQGKSTKYVVSGSDNITAGFFMISSVSCWQFRAPEGKRITRLS